MNLTRVKQATSEFIKVLRYGKSDVQTADPVLPHGIDSKPVVDDIAVYAKTNSSNQGIILGYLKNSDITAEGETRIYATDTNGVLKFDIKLKNDATCELGGDADNAVRYSPVNTALNQQATDINTELGKISTAIASLGGAYTPATISIDISGAKIDEIKTL